MIPRKRTAGVKPGGKKAQVWSLDLVVSAFVFIGVLVALLFAWSYVNDESRLQATLRRMEAKSLDMSESLAMTPGNPGGWSPADVEVIGLAQGAGILNSTKVLYFAGMDYEQARLRLGTGLYDFYFRVRDGDNQTLQVDGTPAEAGSYPGDAALVVPTERYVVLDGVPAVMEFVLWS
jgi:hypothetical protein